MKQHLLNSLILLFALIAGTGSVRAEEEICYTLTPASGSNNSYANSCDIAIDGITWNLTGNSTVQPWRIGGKSISKKDRALYSKTALTDDVTKIVVTHGAASSITVNSWTVIVSKNSDFSDPISTLTPSFAANGPTTITRPDGKDWSNCYFKFVYNVTVSGSSNKFIEFTSAAFYKESGSSDPVAVAGVSLNKSTLDLEVGETSTLTATIAPANATDKVVTWTSSDEDVATVENGVVTAEGVGSATITVTTHDGSYAATCDVTVTLAPEATLTFDFTDDAWGFPESYALTSETYTNDGYTITLGASSNGHKVMTSGGKITALIWGKENATLTLPAFPFNVSKIKVYGNSVASGKVTLNIFVGDAAVSTEVTGSTTNHEFEIADANQAAGTVYTLKLTNDNNCQISKIEVFGYEPVTVSTVGYATYCSANALDFTGAGVKAYVGTVSGGNLTFTPVTEVPANTGLLLYKEGGATVNVPVIASAAAVGTNCLTGVNTATTITSDDYILNKVGENVGFYKAGSFTSLAAHRAYITASAAAKIKNFVLNFDETDGIVEIMRNGDNEKMSAIFDLSGRRVSKPTKGIYVKNGRKFIVK